jgi:hypothetical protein
MLIVAGAALGAGPVQPPPEPPLMEVDERAALRERLERRLGETNRARERLESALRRLEEGAPLESVRAETVPWGERRGGPGEPGRRRGAGPHGPAPGPAEGPESDRRLVLGFLERFNPEGLERMKAVIRDDPEGARRWIVRLAPRVRELMAEKDDQLRELRIEEFRNGQALLGAARVLAAAHRGPEPDEVKAEAARAELREALGRQFDLRMKIREREIAVLEERIRQLRAELEDQAGSREAFVEEKLGEIRRAAREWAEHEGRRPPPGP